MPRQLNKFYKRNKPKTKAIKNVGTINNKWTELMIEKEAEQEPDTDEIKKTIVQMFKRKEKSPQDETTDEFIRINRQTYAPIEVKKDRNGRTIYTPIIANASPSISFAAETRSPNGSDTEESSPKPVEDELIEVQYPITQGDTRDLDEPDAKIKVNVEVILPKATNNKPNKKSYQFYESCLTKKELVQLITDEIKLEDTEMINLVEILNQAALNKAEPPNEPAELQSGHYALC